MKKKAHYANWKTPAILAALLAISATLVYWMEFSYRPKKEAKEEESKKVFQLKNQAIQSIHIVTQDKTWSFQCLDLDKNLCKAGDQSRWEMTSPAKFTADASNINSMISSIKNMDSGDPIDLSQDSNEKREELFNDYGLNGKTYLELKISNGTSLKALVGGVTPIGEQVFAAMETQGSLDRSKVYKLPGSFKKNFDQTLLYWRDKKILPITPSDVVEFDLKGSKAKTKGVKKDGQWTIEVGGEKNIPGDVENIDGLISAAAYLNAKEFVSDNKKDSKARQVLAGAKKILDLSLKTQGSPGMTTSLQLYEKTEKGETKIFATSSAVDALSEMEPGVRNRLDKELKDLRQVRLISSVEQFSTKRLELSGKPIGQTSLMLTHEEGQWTLQSPDKKGLNSPKAAQLLESLSGKRIRQFIKANKAPSGQDQGITVTLGIIPGGSSPETTRKFVFWQAQSGLYARDITQGPSSTEVFEVDNSIKDALPWSGDAITFFTEQKESSEIKK